MENENKIDYKIGGQIWVQKDGQNFMGPGRVALLENLAKGLSLEETASNLNMSIDIAQKNIKAINEISKKPLVLKDKNGKYEVTKSGKNIIEIYNKLKEEHNKFLIELNNNFHL